MIKDLLLKFIKIYQYLFSWVPRSCRFSPTCSEYALQAINKYGVIRGVVLTAKRILKCHPLHPGGIDEA